MLCAILIIRHHSWALRRAEAKYGTLHFANCTKVDTLIFSSTRCLFAPIKVRCQSTGGRHGVFRSAVCRPQAGYFLGCAGLVTMPRRRILSEEAFLQPCRKIALSPLTHILFFQS